MNPAGRQVLQAAEARAVDGATLDLLRRGLEQGRSPWEVLAILRQRGLDPMLASHLEQVARQAAGTPGTQPAAIPPSSGGQSAFGPVIPQQIGPYRIEGEISRGGMGIVLRARHETLQRPVAVKVLLAGKQATARAIERFATEARAVARLRHPNVVGIHEVGQDALGPYLVMDLIQGESLGKRIRRDGALAPEPAARIAQRIADALAYAHQHRLLHRDVKPDNVLLDADDVPVLTDFGLARELDVQDKTRLTREGQLVGTPAYTPPEQLMGQTQAIDARADVYALGATLYEMLTGALPFPHTEQLSLAQAIVSEAPPPPSSLAPAIDRDLETICLTCLEKDPADRYPTAQALATDLQRWLSDLPIAARAPGLVERLRKWTRRNLALAASLLLALTLGILGLVVGAALFVGQARRERDQATEARVEAQRQRDEATQARVEAQRQRDEATAAREAADVARGDLEAQHEQTEAQLERATLLLGHALEQKGLRAFEGREWREAAAFYAAALAREDTPARRARLGASLDRAWSHALLPGSAKLQSWAWRPDGRVFAGAASRGPLRVWSARGELVSEQDVGRVTALAWSPDGELLAAGGRDGTLTVLAPGAAPRSVRAHDRVLDVHWVDRSRVATRGRDGAVAVFDRALSPLASCQIGPKRGQKGSDDWGDWGWTGTAVVVAPRREGKQVVRWDLAREAPVPIEGMTTREVFTRVTPVPGGRGVVVGGFDGIYHQPDPDAAPRWLWQGEVPEERLDYGGTTDVGFDPSGRFLAKAQRGQLVVWDLAAAAPSARAPWSGRAVRELAWSPDGEALAVSDRETVALFAPDGSLRGEHRVSRGGLQGLGWDRHGQRLAGRIGDRITVWARGEAEPETELVGHTAGIRALAWAPVGDGLISVANDGARLWTPPRRTSFEGQLPVDPSLSWFEPAVWLDARRVALVGTQGANQLVVFDALTGVQEWRLEVDATSLQRSPDGALLLAQRGGAQVTVFDTTSWAQVGSFRLSRATSDLRWCPTAPRLASVTPTHLQVYDPSGELLAEHLVAGQGEGLRDEVDWSPDGRFVAGTVGPLRSGPYDVWVCELETGALRRAPSGAKRFMFTWTRWSPDGRFLCTQGGVEPTATLTLWDPVQLQVLHAWTGSTLTRMTASWWAGRLIWFDGARVLSFDPERPEGAPPELPCAGFVSCSPDGTQVARSQRGWLQLVRFPSGELLHELRATAPRTAWAPDGARLVVHDTNVPPRIVRVPTAQGTPAELAARVTRELGLRVEDLDLVPAGE